ncbi:MAG: DUF1592 domain-containing protein [Opitutaceae bacterium]|nr:DUF1592 domain-containing protein [Opitutaceae bacterium]
MKRPPSCLVALLGWALGASADAAESPAFFRQFCFECHGEAKAKGHFNFERLAAQPSVGPHVEAWEKVIEMIESGDMPPGDADKQPGAAEKNAAAAWARTTLRDYERKHAGEPGRVTVRRLTSGEYAYAIRDLTGVDVKVPIDAASDSVGGEGFTNFGDVQTVQDANLERYLEAAKAVAEHAMVGAGPLHFSADTGRTGLELSALNRINELYATKGFRVVSGEGGKPFGLERYGKAFFAAWVFQHRAALGEPAVTLRELAAREGITGRFADHIADVTARAALGYPARDMVARWREIPAPAGPGDAAALARARAVSGELAKQLTTWPSWFFGRGDLAAGGAGDESPLVFDDKSLAAVPGHTYTYALGQRFFFGRGGRGAPPPAPGAPVRVVLNLANINPLACAQPVVIWRNARVVTRAIPARTRGDADPAAPVANNGVNPTAATGGRGRFAPGPVLSTKPLRTLLSAEAAAALAFGRSPDGSPLGEDDFAATGTVTIELPPAAAGTTAELVVDAVLGANRDAVVRLLVSDSEAVPARGARARVFLGDPASAGYRTFRAGIAEYVALLPPNSHGEANPADKDPVPAPFDNTYNSPEHDAFVLKVKYQRTDSFFTANLVDGAERDHLNHAWHDLLGSWPYHDAYLGMLAEHYGVKLQSPRMADLGAAQMGALPAEMRAHVAPLRAHYDETVAAFARAEPGHLDDVLAFAGRAWRRALTAAEATRLRNFYQRARTENALDHDGAVRALLARILVAPEFLYRVETVAARTEQPLNDWELASRLSFFLWSSVPDDELRRAATAGELRRPELLAKQVRRMAADAKARRLATEFFGQWLGFYRFDEFRGVDTARFPEFTDEVRIAMYDEAVSTFEHLVRERRPLRELLHADYTFLNQPLAKFYGLKTEVASKDAVVKVEGAAAPNRGGVLRLGAVLTTTSAPLRTSPVKRGDWLLRRILGTPTPPPPADAGSLPSDPKSFGSLTLRQKLDEHKRNPACANCHLRIDPLGFPLEAFDAIGRYRTAYDDGVAVDVTGEFADKSVITGADGLLGYLRTKEPLVMKTLAKKMLGYALGRTVLASDRALIDEMVAAGGEATFADLAVKVASSRQFRHREGRDDETARPSQ